MRRDSSGDEDASNVPVILDADYFIGFAAGDNLVKQTTDHLVKVNVSLAAPERNPKLRVQKFVERFAVASVPKNLLLLGTGWG